MALGLNQRDDLHYMMIKSITWSFLKKRLPAISWTLQSTLLLFSQKAKQMKAQNHGYCKGHPGVMLPYLLLSRASSIQMLRSMSSQIRISLRMPTPKSLGEIVFGFECKCEHKKIIIYFTVCPYIYIFIYIDEI